METFHLKAVDLNLIIGVPDVESTEVTIMTPEDDDDCYEPCLLWIWDDHQRVFKWAERPQWILSINETENTLCLGQSLEKAWTVEQNLIKMGSKLKIATNNDDRNSLGSCVSKWIQHHFKVYEKFTKKKYFKDLQTKRLVGNNFPLFESSNPEKIINNPK